MELNKNVSWIELPKENFTCPEEKNMVVSGWGMTWLDDWTEGQGSRFLMASEQQKCLDAEKHCPSRANETPQYKDGFICSGDLEAPNSTITENSACHGDSGGNETI